MLHIQIKTNLVVQMNKKRRIERPDKANTATTSIKIEPKPNSHMRSISSIPLEKFSTLSPDFYQIDALDLAPRLLGKHLKKDDVILQITEVLCVATTLALPITIS